MGPAGAGRLQLSAFLPFQSFPPGQNKSKEETKRKERDEYMAMKRKEQGDRGRVEIHTCDGEAT